MSLKHQILRDLVVERLVVAADEIFALFERTFAEYEEDVRMKIHEETRLELQKREGLCSELGVQTGLVSPEVKYEHGEAQLELPFTSVPFKSEENIDKSCFYQEEPPEEHSHDAAEPLYGAEEPGCSMASDMNEFGPYSCSDTDNSEDWASMGTPKTKSNGQTFDRFLNEELRADILSANEQNPEYGQVGWPEGEASARKQGSERSQTPVNRGARSKRDKQDKQDKPFSCAVCKKTFPQKRNLKSHMRVHTGERPYHCIPCGLSFKFQQNYNQHDLTVHRKDKPFRCRVCKKDFVDKSEMIAHRSSHDSSFSCSICDKVFNTKKYLRRHLERCPMKKRPRN